MSKYEPIKNPQEIDESEISAIAYKKPIETIKGESLMLLGFTRHENVTYRMFYGIGIVYRVVKREKEDLVYINFGIFKEHPRRLVVVKDNHARRQLLTLKRGQCCHVYGLCRYYIGLGKEINGERKKELKFGLYANAILGWYVPTMVDIKKMPTNEDIVAPTDAENEIADFLGEIEKWKD